MANILLIEPNYKCKQPPLGLMKISYFHKNVMHDYVRFAKGRLPKELAGTKWDKVYVTSLFTFEWKATMEAIDYAKSLVDSIDKVSVGGIAATMLPDQIFEETGIKPICGLLNVPGKLGLPGDECIDQIVPDYSMLNDIDYIYPFNDAYFLSATKGCGNKCGFCAVQTLEPTFIPYIDIKSKISAIDEEFGTKKDLILMDNNVLRSPRFNEIIDDIIEAGFYKGAKYKNPKTGKIVQRFVDFNQGLDALFLNEAKAKRLGEIALRPARIAFDHIEDREIYERSLRLCAKYGITDLSNYVLYNSEDFGGKGKIYHADTPEDLYDRMRFTLDLKDEINESLPEDTKQVAAFSFPMRYIPLSAHERGYVGSNWNAKYLRAVQCMLIPTQGKGVGSRSFFEADFGKSSSEFVRYLCMPEKLILNRGKISKTSRGNSKESEEEYSARRKEWNKYQQKIEIWNKLYDQLGEELDDFIELIGSNEFLPEGFMGIKSLVQRKMYLLYLTTPRLFALLGRISPSSPTYKQVYDFITSECPSLYQDLLDVLVESDSQQNYIFLNFISFFGKEGIKDLLQCLENNDFNVDKQLSKWDSICKRNGVDYVDFELIRVYRRYVELGILPKKEHNLAKGYIISMDMFNLAGILNTHLQTFEEKLFKVIDRESGSSILKKITKSISNNIQLKLFNFLEVKM